MKLVTILVILNFSFNQLHIILVSPDRILSFKQVAIESIKIYQAISDGTVNLVDKVGCNLGFLFKKFGY